LAASRLSRLDAHARPRRNRAGDALELVSRRRWTVFDDILGDDLGRLELAQLGPASRGGRSLGRGARSGAALRADGAAYSLWHAAGV